MKISIICSDRNHPIFPYLMSWKSSRNINHEIRLVESSDEICEDGDILFLVSCMQIITSKVRKRFRACLVIHASDVPKGRGWSPLTWQIMEGRNSVTVSMLEAEDNVDSGAVWCKREISFQGHELLDEMNDVLFHAELQLMDYAIENLYTVQPVPQTGDPSYYRRRTPEDSRLNIHETIAEQFNLLRVVDNERYPAFFEHLGCRYQILIKKADDHES